MKIRYKISFIMLVILFVFVGCEVTDTTKPEVNIIWHVQPTLQHERIIRCGMCDAFLDQEDRSISIDPQTGLSGEHHCDMILSSGVWLVPFVYDQQRGLFGHPGSDIRNRSGGGGWSFEQMIGMHPFDTFDEAIMLNGNPIPDHILDRTRGFIAVESVDSSARVDFIGYDDRDFRLAEDARLGKFAIMYNREFITGFIFDDTIRLNGDIFGVYMDGSWGAIDRYGNLILPFEFEHFLRISNYAAFAKHGGAYGILDLTQELN